MLRRSNPVVKPPSTMTVTWLVRELTYLLCIIHLPVSLLACACLLQVCPATGGFEWAVQAGGAGDDEALALAAAVVASEPYSEPTRAPTPDRFAKVEPPPPPPAPRAVLLASGFFSATHGAEFPHELRAFASKSVRRRCCGGVVAGAMVVLWWCFVWCGALYKSVRCVCRVP